MQRAKGSAPALENLQKSSRFQLPISGFKLPEEARWTIPGNTYPIC